MFPGISQALAARGAESNICDIESDAFGLETETHGSRHPFNPFNISDSE
jgi:hypothetical protein